MFRQKYGYKPHQDIAVQGMAVGTQVVLINPGYQLLENYFYR
jgi:hypothetical protein